MSLIHTNRRANFNQAQNVEDTIASTALARVSRRHPASW
jgi:hypothetical protein